MGSVFGKNIKLSLFGEYDVAGKLKKGHMTYQAIVGAYYKNAHEIKNCKRKTKRWKN